MRFLICILAVVSASVFSQTQDPTGVWVIGTGSNKKEAMDDGFKTAIEIISGTVTLSEREIRKDTITKNEVFNYSAGYIKKYNILNIIENKSSTTINMIVWVDSSKLLNYKLNTGKTTSTIDGNNVSAQFQSYINERSAATNLVNKIINDYPKQAFEITQGSYTITTDEYRVMHLNLDVNIKWSQKYLTSLKETLANVSNDELTDVNILILTEKPGSIFFNEAIYSITDYEMSSTIVNRFHKNMQINASLYNNNGKIIQTTCFTIDDNPFIKKVKSNFYRMVYSKQVTWSISMTINKNLYNKLSQIDHLELSLENNCMPLG